MYAIRSYYDIDREALLNKGIKALLFDIDNTLVPMYQKDADEKITKYIEESKNRITSYNVCYTKLLR